MEKVPSLDMFTQRHLRKSSSLSRINHHESSSRPISSFQLQSTFTSNTHSNSNNYYGQALKILNTESRISQNLKQIDSRHEGLWKKSNLKKVARNQQPQQYRHNTVQTAEFAGNTFPPQVANNQQQRMVNVSFNNANRQNVQPMPVGFVPNNNQVIFHGPIPPFPPQQFIQVQGEPAIRIIPQHFQQIPVQHFQPQIPLQRGNSTQNLQYREYNQPDRVLSSSNIPPTCNNEQELKPKTRPQQTKPQTYTFRETDHAQQPAPKKTYNPFLFDATYLLEIKDSQSRLPDITLATNNKEYYEQLDKKRELMQQLNEIKESNLIQGQHFLNQLDCLIQQFQGRQSTKGRFLDESEMRGSRRSLFAKVQ